MSTLNLDVAIIRPRGVFAWNQVKACLAEWRHRARSRYELTCLNNLDLHDIGLSRCDAESEAAKPFWQA
jgi:uncharacterized protein YjiS (DUF1127 family)